MVYIIFKISHALNQRFELHSIVKKLKSRREKIIIPKAINIVVACNQSEKRGG